MIVQLEDLKIKLAAVVIEVEKDQGEGLTAICMVHRVQGD